MLLDYSIHFMVIEKLQLRLCLCINWNFKSVWLLFSLFIWLSGKSPTGPRKLCFNSWTADICKIRFQLISLLWSSDSIFELLIMDGKLQLKAFSKVSFNSVQPHLQSVKQTRNSRDLKQLQYNQWDFDAVDALSMAKCWHPKK